jgi:nucleotide-binding universal stress UspA family protein
MGLFNVVVVGADDSPTARKAIEAASQLAHMSSGTLHIVTAIDPKPRHEGSLPSEFKNMNPDGEAEALLQVLSFIAKKIGVEPILHYVAGDPADAIISVADQVNADLIVVGNRGMKGARRVLGSVPNSVAHGANCSVAIIDTTN